MPHFYISRPKFPRRLNRNPAFTHLLSKPFRRPFKRSPIERRPTQAISGFDQFHSQ